MADIAVFSSFRRPLPPDKADQGLSSQAETAPTPPPPTPLLPEPPPPEPPTPPPSPEITGPDRAELLTVPLDCDQLGLAHPSAVMLQAQLPGSEPVALAAETAGLYRPSGFRPAPWSGFSYDQATNALAGMAAGTRILTARGEIEVERLVPGDTAMALRGPALLPISWIGRSIASAPTILIEPGALGPDIPRRPLHLGPDQAVYIKPTPVAARTLVNGTTVRLVEADKPELFHIDLGRAEVIFAEGLALSSSTRPSSHP